MLSARWLVHLFVIGFVLLGSVGMAGAHDSQTVNGYELTFGGSVEPVITGERMWLEVRIADAETDEPVMNLEDDLEMAVQRPFGNDTFELDVSSRFGEPGWYEAAVIFTEPGTYMVYLNGTIDGSAVDTTFQTQVHNAADLRYPNPAPESNQGPGMDAALSFGLGAVVAAVGMVIAFAAGRRIVG